MDDEMSIKIENVSKSYTLGKTHIPALKHISLEIEPEDFLVIAGPSGSGKTTLLNLIGLIDKPSSGRVLFGDRDVTQTSLNGLHGFRRDRLGYIFQGFNLISVLSVYENVEYPLILKNMSRKERKEKVDAVLERVGLADRKKHKPNQLSGGQRQRVSIARAVVKDPQVVLADEPTANLDSRTGGDILALMERLNEEENISFVFSSHDPMIIEKAKRVIKLKDGEITNGNVN